MKAYIFGSGFSGATSARLLADAGFEVILFEQNSHIGGNAYDYEEDGLLVHKYGPHIFHTDSDEVFEFLSRFTNWTKYEHRVLGKIDGRLVPIPFNLTSLAALFEAQKADYIRQKLTQEIGIGAKVPILQLMEQGDEILKSFAKYVYEKVFYNYTLKQWGFTPEMLPKGVTARVPVYISYEDRYFTDKYQFMPQHGYTRLFETMLSHPNIKTVTNSSAQITFDDASCTVKIDGAPANGIVIYTGCIDRLLNYRLGVLPYRTLEFKFERHAVASYQPAAVVNYPNEEAFTRISEFSKFTCPAARHTVIVKEYPNAHIPEKTIPYYPIEREENKALYESYRNYLSNFANFYPLGRLAEYKYINMDVAVKNAVALCGGIIKCAAAQK